MKIFSLTVYGTTGIVSKDKPLRTPADFKGQLVSINTPLQGDYIKALGGAPVVIDWLDDVPSLQKGLVTASILSSPAGLYPMGYYDVCKYYTDNKLYAGCMVISMNLDRWKEMPNAVQKMLLEAGEDFAVDQYQTFKKVEEDFTKAIEDEGMTLIYLTPQERAEWIKAVQPVIDAYWASLPADIAEGLQAAAKRANSKFP